MLQYWGGTLKKKFVKFVVQDLTSGGVDWQREKWQSGFGSKFIRQGEKNAVKYRASLMKYEKAEAANTQGNSGSTAGKTAKVWRGARCCWRWAM